ncbi:MAG: ATP-binding cassette domain-containing protein, partial [Rhodospirillales bacterium]|nr:ATP-binding cassette domain-containing protein [Rhodospirillales bacterium]
YAGGGRRLLGGISFTLKAGPRTIILGPNGAGKSLLLRLCHGLIEPSEGTIRWSAPAERRQAMVFQHPVMLRRTALANVEYALALHDVPRRMRRGQAVAALEQAGLLPLAGRPARVLSGGEQQRLALARAWAVRPEVLFLDEPTASLDPAAVRAFEEHLGAIHATGTKIIMTTHDLGQARRLAEEVLFLHRGRLVEHSPAADFFTSPDSAEAGAFISGGLLW